MKEFLDDNLVLERDFIGNEFSFMKNQITERILKPSIQVKKKKNIFIELPIRRKTKSTTDFSSLERIRIVLDGMIGELSKEQICKKEKIL